MSGLTGTTRKPNSSRRRFLSDAQLNQQRIDKERIREIRRGLRNAAKERRKQRRSMRARSFSRFRSMDMPSREGANPDPNATLGVFNTYINGSLAITKIRKFGSFVQRTLHGKKTWDQLNPGPPYRTGGPFASVEYRVPAISPRGRHIFNNLGAPGTSPGNYKEYVGEFKFDSFWIPGETIASYTDSTLASFPSLASYHTAAWDKLKPTIPKLNLAQALGESRDLPRMLRTSASAFRGAWNVHRREGRLVDGDFIMRPKSAADQFLNVEFGWSPFLRDIASMYDLVQNQMKYISDTVRNNNQWIRRRRVLDETTSNERLLLVHSSGTIPSSNDEDMNAMTVLRDVEGISSKGTQEFRKESRTTVWAVGSFKYYRPEFDDNLAGFNDWTQFGHLRRMMNLAGLRINPSLVWELTPWSWLVDWFSSFGNFISRHDDFITDGIISRYLYLMRSEEAYVTRTCNIHLWNGTLTFHAQRMRRMKQREVANSPYGFNAPWNNLSARQLAILAAIGISGSNSGFSARGA